MNAHNVTLVIGVGDPYRRDDGVGLIAGRRLAAAARGRARFVEGSGAALPLMEAWAGAEAVIVIDAVRAGAEPGTVHRVDPHAASLLRPRFRSSTHGAGVAEAIELARALGRLPPRVVVLGVEGRQFDPGVGLSPEVEAAIDEVVARGLREIGP